MSISPALPGRRAQAARNDGVILQAARDVFLADPKAPISAVSERAGVGISALYRRYANKEDLLRNLCHDGLRRFNEIAERAQSEADGWQAFTTFLHGVVEADVHSLTVHLAGTFTPTPEMDKDARRSSELVTTLVRRAQEAGRLREDADANDVAFLLEACAAIRVPDGERTRTLRSRYLTVLLDGLAAGRTTTLPGPPPDSDEMNWRWQR
jgi:AcrR family transcriptional regulator